MSSALLDPNSTSGVQEELAISIEGRWVRVPVFNIAGNTIVVAGRRLKIAFIPDEEYMGRELQSPKLCIEELTRMQHRGARADLLTFSQRIPNTVPKYDYRTEWDSIAIVGTRSFREWWERLPQGARRDVRRAEKRGVVVKVKQLDDDLIRGIIGVNNDSPVRQNKAFVHFGKTFDQVKYDQSSFLDRSDFICAYVGDELIGFLKVAYNDEVASLVQLLPKASHHDKSPANALLAKAVEVCEARGVSYLTYGKYNYGNKRDSSLRQFKVRNGFAEMLVPRYYVPLSSWGSLNLRLNTHHGLLGILPPIVISWGLRARTKWRTICN